MSDILFVTVDVERDNLILYLIIEKKNKIKSNKNKMR
jgi:hypothetical protein